MAGREWEEEGGGGEERSHGCCRLREGQEDNLVRDDRILEEEEARGSKGVFRMRRKIRRTAQKFGFDAWHTNV